MTDPTSKDATSPQAPYLCPHCNRPANLINFAMNKSVGLITFYHGGAEGCSKILSCQIVQPEPNKVQVAQPGRVRLT